MSDTNNRPGVQGGPSVPENENETQSLDHARSANVLLVDAGHSLDDIAESWMMVHSYHDAPKSLVFDLTRRWRPDPEMASQPLQDRQHGEMRFVPVQLGYDDRNPDRLILQGYLTEDAQLEAPLVLINEDDGEDTDLVNMSFRHLLYKISKGSFVKLFFDLSSGTGYVHHLMLCDAGLQVDPAIPDDSIFSDDPDHTGYCPDCCMPSVDESALPGIPQPLPEPADTPDAPSAPNPET